VCELSGLLKEKREEGGGGGGGGEKKRDKGIQKVAILSKNDDF